MPAPCRGSCSSIDTDGGRPERIRRVLVAAHMRRFVLAALAIWSLAAPVAAAGDSQEAWAALGRGGHVALIRHGNAPPGYGDPPGFKIDDCATQRNLDERGRAQGRALGEAFRQHGVRADKILSSAWCRCLETARLMALGPVDGTWTAAASDRSCGTGSWAGRRLRMAPYLAGPGATRGAPAAGGCSCCLSSRCRSTSPGSSRTPYTITLIPRNAPSRIR